MKFVWQKTYVNTRRIMFDKDYIKGLINEEYADYSIYESEAELFKNKIVNGSSISNIFLKFANDELKHVNKLKQIFDLNMVPEKRIIPKMNSLRETLRMHLMRESEAIKAYNDIIKECKDKNIREVLSQIITDEEKHYREIKKYLLLIR